MGNSSSKHELEESLREVEEPDKSILRCLFNKLKADSGMVSKQMFLSLNAGSLYKDAMSCIWDGFLTLCHRIEQAERGHRHERRLSNPFVHAQKIQEIKTDAQVEFYSFVHSILSWYRMSRHEVECLFLCLLHQQALEDSVFYYLTLAMNLYDCPLIYSETSTKRLREFCLSSQADRDLGSVMKVALNEILYCLLMMTVAKENSIVISERARQEKMTLSPIADESDLLNKQECWFLHFLVPMDCKWNRWNLIFSMNRDGRSWTVLLSKIVMAGSLLIVIRDKKGFSFGAFIADALTLKPSFQASNQCFLFSLSPSMQFYQSSNINSNYVYLNGNMSTLPNGLGFGGQLEYFGLFLDDKLQSGHSKAHPLCSTYSSPCLSSSEYFEIDDIEVWLVKESPLSSDFHVRKETKDRTQTLQFLELAGQRPSTNHMS